MSQHIFKTEINNQPVSVIIGWDRPKKEYFLMVEDEDGDYPYHSDIDKSENSFDESFFKKILFKMGITLPATVFEQLSLDRTSDTVNRFCVYQADGSFVDRMRVADTAKLH